MCGNMTAQALWYGSTRVEDGSYSGGQVVTVLLSAIIGGASIGQAGPNLQYFQNGCVAAKRVFDVIDRWALQPSLLLFLGTIGETNPACLSEGHPACRWHQDLCPAEAPAPGFSTPCASSSSALHSCILLVCQCGYCSQAVR